MTHYSTLIQRCRSTNSLLADELSDEFHRLETDRLALRLAVEGLLDTGENFSPQAEDRARHALNPSR